MDSSPPLSRFLYHARCRGFVLADVFTAWFAYPGFKDKRETSEMPVASLYFLEGLGTRENIGYVTLDGCECCGGYGVGEGLTFADERFKDRSSKGLAHLSIR